MPLVNPPLHLPSDGGFGDKIFDLLRSQGRYFFVSAVVVLCVYFITAVMRSFAGQVTIASFTVRVLVDIFIKWALTVTISGFSIALYLGERKQHEKTRERLTKRITELELHIHPARTSSHLTSKGRTRKEDE